MKLIDFQPYRQDSNYKIEENMCVILHNGTEGIIHTTDNYYFLLLENPSTEISYGYYHRMDIKTIKIT